MSSEKALKDSSRDSGMGLFESDSEFVSPPKRTSSCGQSDEDKLTLEEPNAKNCPSWTPWPNVNVKREQCLPSLNIELEARSESRSRNTLLKSVSDEKERSNSLLSPQADDMAPQIRPRSVSDVRHQASPVRIFQLKYFGEMILDKRVTQSMIPWITDELCQPTKNCSAILLQVSKKGVLGISEFKGTIMFEHNLHNICRFVQGHKERCFSYQWRTDVENSRAKLYAFQASELYVVDNIADNIKNTAKSALQLDADGGSFSKEVGMSVLQDLKDNNCTMFEVLYCGRIGVSHRRAPPSLIDDAVEKFKEHEKDMKKKMLETFKNRHFSSEDQLDRFDDGNDSVSSDSKISKSVEEIVGKESSKTPSQCSSSDSISVPESAECGNFTEDDLSPQVRERTNSGTSTSSDGPRRRNKLTRQDTLSELVNSRDKTYNRTMVFQIGKTALTLVSTDNKSFALTKKFTEISYCSQGIKYPEYFGFICREHLEESSHFRCYVFRVQDEATVDVIMATLKQSFAAALQESRNNVVCETCPMHKFHKLCIEIKDKSPENALINIRHHVDSLPEGQRHSLTATLRASSPSNQQEQNELIMAFLRKVYEAQQQGHTHVSEGVPISTFTNPVSPAKNTATSTQEGPFRKAKKSLASSFESLLSRNRNKPSRSNSSTPELPRKQKIDESQKENISSLANKIHAETSPLEESVSPLSDRSNSQPSFTSPDVSTSPLTGTTQPTTSTPNVQKPANPPKTLSINTSTSPLSESPPLKSPPVAIRRVSHETRSTQKSPLPDPVRPRSKTLGDEPTSPRYESRRTDEFQFVTPKERKVMNRRSMPPPLSRAMSVNLDGSFGLSAATTPKRKMSFRQQIFNRVVTTPISEKKSISDIAEEGEDVFTEKRDLEGEAQQMKRQHIRSLWKRAINEQILLIRMEKMNQIMEKATEDAVSEKQRKLGYEEMTPCLKEVANQWENLLKQDKDIFHDPERVNSLFKQGVPRLRCGQVWRFLMRHMRRKSPSSVSPIHEHEPYSELLKQLTTHQHAILIDLGRTYPHHAHFTNPLGRGQLSLFNLLKAYSLLDAEVGYCQGLSFVAGFLLIHLDEKEAFDMLVYLMYGLGFRRQYKADMIALQIKMYQLSRLLHDHHRELHDHLEQNEVSPSLYAAPWFLTFFASQFHLGFIARIFDMVFLQGGDVIFKLALVILASHKEKLLECDGFEAIIRYLKDVVPNVNFVELEKIISQAYSLDITKQLQAYEVEYHVIQEEMVPSPMHTTRSISTDLDQLETANRNLRRHNEELLEQLQTARNTMHNLETTVQALQDSEAQLKSKLRLKNNERNLLIDTIIKLKSLVPKDKLESNGLTANDIENILSGAVDSSYQRSTSLPTYCNGNFILNGHDVGSNKRNSSSTSDDSLSSGVSSRSGWVLVDNEISL